jgi:hypothetical protein
VNDSGAIPIEKGVPGGRKGPGAPTFRYNPKTGVGALSVEAYTALGEPAKVGIWVLPHSDTVIIGPTDNEYIGRKVSKKRTFSVTRLREFLGVDDVTRWKLDRYGEESLSFDVEQGES